MNVVAGESSFGPGKVILLGEHGVVYGQPALAGPLSRGVRAWSEPSKHTSLEIPEVLSPAQRLALERAFSRVAKLTGHPAIAVHVDSDLPPSMGLGSSGALAVAVTRLMLRASGQRFTQARLERVAFEMEKEFHGTPSGVDHTTSARGSLILFRKGKATTLRPRRPVKVLIALAGERASTKETVLALRERQARWPQRYTRLFQQIGAVVRDGATSAVAGDLEGLGDAMNVNQGLLNALGLSSLALEAMVARLRSAGALGAKLTGAGGDGGAVIGLFREPEPVVIKLRKAGIDCFASQLAGPEAL